MAINFADVKNLTIPQGSVVKITDSNGVILYNKTLYRELAYIEGDGVNYVQTNTKPNRTATYVMEMAFTSSSVGNALNGSETSSAGSNSARFKFGKNSSGNLYMGFGASVSTTVAPTPDEFYTFSAAPGAQTIKDSSENIIISASNTLPSSGLNNNWIILFGLNIGSTVSYVANSIGMRIKSYYMTYNNVTYYFIPAQRKSDGKCGFYNTVNNTFYEEQGDGALIPGPIVNENPSWSLTTLMNSYSNAGGSDTIFAVTTGTTAAETNTLLTFNQDPSYLILTCTLYHGSVSGTGTKSGAIWVKSFNDNTGTYIINNSSTSSDTQTVTSVKIQLNGSGTLVFAGCRGTAGGYTSSVELQYDKTNHILQVYRHGATQASTACRMSDITIEAYY